MFIFKNTIIVGISCAKIVHSNELFCFLKAYRENFPNNELTDMNDDDAVS